MQWNVSCWQLSVQGSIRSKNSCGRLSTRLSLYRTVSSTGTRVCSIGSHGMRTLYGTVLIEKWLVCWLVKVIESDAKRSASGITCLIIISVATIVFCKSKLRLLFHRGRSKSRYFPSIFSTIFNAFYEQHLSCVFSVYAICTAHDYFIIVTHTLHLSTKKTHLIMCFIDHRSLLLPALSHFCLQTN